MHTKYYCIKQMHFLHTSVIHYITRYHYLVHVMSHTYIMYGLTLSLLLCDEQLQKVNQNILASQLVRVVGTKIYIEQ